MKKFWVSILAVLLAMGLVFGAVGCGSDTADNSADQPKQEEPAAPEINEQEVLDAAVVDYYANLPESNNLIDYDSMKAKVEAGTDNLLILDIRAPEDYVKGHIAGAINVPAAKIGEKLEVIRANAEGKEVYVVCYSGQNAGMAVSLLNATGIPAVSIKSGMGKEGGKTGWLNEGYPMVTEEATFAKEAGAALEGEAKVIADAVTNYYVNMPEHKYFVPAEELNKMLTEKADSLYIIDIRKPEDFAKGHIKGAVNIPFGKIGENLAKIKADSTGKEVFVACYSGQTAAQTVGLLNADGVAARSVLYGMGKEGGAKGWISEGFELVTE